MDSCTMDIKVDIKGVLDLYYQGQLYVFPRAQPEGNTYSCTRLYKQ